jgi:hypothetical protein
MKNINSQLFQTELINVEEDNDKLRIEFRTTSNEPLVFKFNNSAVVLTENFDIYEVDFQVFPIITLKFFMKNAGTNYNEIKVNETVVDIDTLGFNDYNEFKQFIIKHPLYVRYIDFIYTIFNMRPWLFLLYTSRIRYKYDMKITSDEIKITIEQIHIHSIFKKYNINGKMMLRILNKNGNLLLVVGNVPVIHFGITATYDDIIKILREKPESVINTLIMLIITLLD